MNTMFFTQCEECENCYTDGYSLPYCALHDHTIDNTKMDGCTWGNKKEDSNERKAD